MPERINSGPFIIRNVNLKATGTTEIANAVSGRTFVPSHAKLLIRTRTGSGAGPEVSIGQASGYNNVTDNVTVDGAAGDILDLQFSPDGEPTNYPFLDLTSAGVAFRVVTASTYTTHTADVLLYGDIL